MRSKPKNLEPWKKRESPVADLRPFSQVRSLECRVGQASSPPFLPLSTEKEEAAKANGETSDSDCTFVCVGSDYPLIPSGEYEVAFIKAERLQQWQRFKIFLWFQIESFGSCQGIRLFLPCNLKSEGTISARSKYYRNWVVATGRKPDRNERKRMGTRVFKGKRFLAKVSTVIKDQKNLPLAPELQYSKIEGLLTRLTD